MRSGTGDVKQPEEGMLQAVGAHCPASGLVEQHAGQQQAPGVVVDHLLYQAEGGGWGVPGMLSGVRLQHVQAH